MLKRCALGSSMSMADLWKFYGNLMESADCRKEAPTRLVLLFGYMRIPINGNGACRGSFGLLCDMA